MGQELFKSIHPLDIKVKFRDVKKFDFKNMESETYKTLSVLGSNDRRVRNMFTFSGLNIDLPFIKLKIDIINKDKCTFVSYGEKNIERILLDESQTFITTDDIKNNHNPIYEDDRNPTGYCDYTECRFRSIWLLQDTLIDGAGINTISLDSFIDYVINYKDYTETNIEEICIQSDDGKEYGESILEFYRVLYLNNDKWEMCQSHKNLGINKPLHLRVRAEFKHTQV